MEAPCARTLVQRAFQHTIEDGKSITRIETRFSTIPRPSTNQDLLTFNIQANQVTNPMYSESDI